MTTLEIIVPPPFADAAQWTLTVDGVACSVSTPIAVGPGAHAVVLYATLRHPALCADSRLTFSIDVPPGGQRRVTLPLGSLTGLLGELKAASRSRTSRAGPSTCR